ncbi:hypothetical protein ACFL1M_04860, partial [Patescibacteria group bacterium]
MKVLFITQLLPWPPRTGGKYKTYRLLKLLSKKNTITLVTFHSDKKFGIVEARNLEKKLGIKVKSFYRPEATAPSKKIKKLALKSLFTNKPFRVYKYFSYDVVNYLKNLSEEVNFDVLYFDHNTSFQYLKYVTDYKNMRIIYDEHNINSLAMLRNAMEKRRRLVVRLFSLVDVVK